MKCVYPIKAWISDRYYNGEKRKKKLVLFCKKGEVWRDSPFSERILIPCGKCIACREDRAKQWAVRCLHESKLYEDNCFVTLTYNDDCLDKRGSLNKKDFPLFMKKLRKLFCNKKIKYFHCGEYGSLSERPHHHACLFNVDFRDKEILFVKNGVKLYRSDMLERLWSKGIDEKDRYLYNDDIVYKRFGKWYVKLGFCTLGEVNYGSACYVARYIIKKVYGEIEEEHYRGRVPEYNTMSRRDGIGKGYIKEYLKDIYPSDCLILELNKRAKIPRYYDNYYKKEDLVGYERVKDKRKEFYRRKEVEFDEQKNLMRKKCITEKIKRRKRL